MTDKQKTWGKYALAVVLVLVLGYLGYSYPAPTPPEAGPGTVLSPESVSVTRFRSVNVEHDLDVDGTANLDDLDIDASGEIEIDGGLTDIGGGTYGTADGDNDLGVAGDLEVVGNAVLSGDVTVDDTLNTDETASALTGSQTITPTATYYQFTPTAALTLTLATGAAADGDILILHNTVATNTNIVDTGATVGGGGIDLGANDLAIFIYGNSKWIEVASPDNS